jgi:hypothetical protein
MSLIKNHKNFGPIVMDILNNLGSEFRIETSKPAATEDDINKLISFSSVSVPDDYLKLVEKMTELEILVGRNKYIRIWGPLGCIEMNQAYQIQKYIPNSLAIGDDEGGMALVLMTGKNGYGLYSVGFGDLDASDAEYIDSSLGSWLTNG